jgi:hypothetical protein
LHPLHQKNNNKTSPNQKASHALLKYGGGEGAYTGKVFDNVLTKTHSSGVEKSGCSGRTACKSTRSNVARCIDHGDGITGNLVFFFCIGGGVERALRHTMVFRVHSSSIRLRISGLRHLFSSGTLFVADR